jgi:carbon-monoxide dehydrogenase large subunit
MRFGIGEPVQRTEDPVLLRGEGRYTDDLNVGAYLGTVAPQPPTMNVVRNVTSVYRTPLLEVGRVGWCIGRRAALGGSVEYAERGGSGG